MIIRIITGASSNWFINVHELPGKLRRFGDGTPVIRLKYTGISHGARCEEMQKQQLLC